MVQGHKSAKKHSDVFRNKIVQLKRHFVINRNNFWANYYFLKMRTHPKPKIFRELTEICEKYAFIHIVVLVVYSFGVWVWLKSLVTKPHYRTHHRSMFIHTASSVFIHKSALTEKECFPEKDHMMQECSGIQDVWASRPPWAAATTAHITDSLPVS